MLLLGKIGDYQIFLSNESSIQISPRLISKGFQLKWKKMKRKSKDGVKKKEKNPVKS